LRGVELLSLAWPCVVCSREKRGGGEGRHMFLLGLIVQLRKRSGGFSMLTPAVFFSLVGLRDTNDPWMELDLEIRKFLFFEANQAIKQTSGNQTNF
jgi:hypothetical protein